MNLLAKIVQQTKKPTGFLGIVITTIMNFGHSKLTDWALRFLDIRQDSVILDIGCGGGKTVNRLAKIITTGKVYGIDYSDLCVDLSSKLNRHYIAQNRVEIKKASVSSIPFEDNSFDIIIAIETYFFWPDLENDMKEVLRVLKPKGKLLVVSETYKNKKNEKSIEKWAKLSNTDDFMHFHTSDDFGKLFAKAGYRDVEVHDNSRHGWICGIGTKG